MCIVRQEEMLVIIIDLPFMPFIFNCVSLISEDSSCKSFDLRCMQGKCVCTPSQQLLVIEAVMRGVRGV